MNLETKQKLSNFLLERISPALPFAVCSLWVAGNIAYEPNHTALLFGIPGLLLCLATLICGRPFENIEVSLPTLTRLRTYLGLQLGRDMVLVFYCLATGHYIWFAIFAAVLYFIDYKPLDKADEDIAALKKKLLREEQNASVDDNADTLP